MITDKQVVDEIETGNPISISSIAVSLYIILASGKVPHKITPVHEIDLIIDKETHVFHKSGFAYRAPVYAYRFSFEIGPFFISSYMTSVGAVHARKEHAKFGSIDIVAFMVDDFIAIGLIFRFFYNASPYGSTLFILRNSVFSFDVGHESLSIEQRTIAILFTVEVAAQSKDIFGEF